MGRKEMNWEHGNLAKDWGHKISKSNILGNSVKKKEKNNLARIGKWTIFAIYKKGNENWKKMKKVDIAKRDATEQ
jgi:phosphoribosylaminoimidazole carboxylase (NCAIR synthetase)